MTDALCSIIVPTFNRPDLALQTIASIQAQSHGSFEAILVDDGSTADNIEILLSAISSDTRFRLVHRDGEARYCGARRNQGLLLCRGQYILFFDSDDLLTPDLLRLRIAAIEDHQLDFVVGQATLFARTPGDLGKTPFARTEGRGLDDDIYNFIAGRTVWQSAGPLYRRTFLDALGAFDVSIESAEDIDLHVRALLMRPRYLKTAEPDYWYRRSSADSITGSAERAEWFYAGVATLIRKLTGLIADVPEPRKTMFRHALWKRTVTAVARAKLGKLCPEAIQGLLNAYTPATPVEKFRRLEVISALAGWGTVFGKVPSLTYLHKRGWLVT